MKNFECHKCIICYQPPRDKSTLIRRDDGREDTFKFVGKRFRQDLIQYRTEAYRSEILHRKWRGTFGNQLMCSNINADGTIVNFNMIWDFVFMPFGET